MQHESIAHEHRPQDWGSLVSQTHNFYQISNDVYRSEQPDTAMISELKDHQIGTIINLRAKDADSLVFKMKILILYIFLSTLGQLTDKIS